MPSRYEKSTERLLGEGVTLCIGLGVYGPKWWGFVALALWCVRAVLVMRDRE